MNNDLISRSELLKRIDEEREYLKSRGQFGAEHILVHNFRDLVENAPTVEPEPISGIQEKALKVVETLTEEHAINVIEEGYLRRGILFDGKSAKGEWICLDGEGLKKARRGKYVIYDVDFLLDNLAREVNIMESARQWKAGKGNDND